MTQEVDPKLLADVDFDTDLVPDQSKLHTVGQLGQKLVDLESRIKLAETELEGLKAQHKNIAEKTLPTAMISAGLTEFTLVDGSKVVVEDGMSLSVPKKNMDRVCLWLRANNHGDIIKRELVVVIPKGGDSDKKVQAVEDVLLRQKLVYSKEENVHSGTLKALLKEQRSAGAEIDLKLFGAYEWQQASIIPPKKQKT